MIINDRIETFSELGNFLSQFKSNGYDKIPHVIDNHNFYDQMVEKIDIAVHYNGWFTAKNVVFAIEQWSKALTKENLTRWITPYAIPKKTPKTIGVIMAGNIPLVGFHDFLSVLISGNRIVIKQSSDDDQLLPLLSSYLIAIAPEFENYISFTKERLDKYDAIIATGSNNTSRYFEYYFKKVPHVIRRNRNSVAILTGKETTEQITTLGKDIFTYFGMGCRNVSKLMVPKGYDFDQFFKSIFAYQDIIHEPKYANNYDYNKAVYLMSNYTLFDNGFLIIKEDKRYTSPIATLFYETYSSEQDLIKQLQQDKEKIQCIVGSNITENTIDFGQSQKPNLWDYADDIDIIEFLLKIA